MSLDITFYAYNRLEFTRASFGLLLANTNWELVDRLLVFDDGSTDGTREFLDDMIGNAPVSAHLAHCGWGSPIKIMNHYLGDGPADLFAKVDNDIAVPPGWLDALLAVLDEHPEVELLGMEGGQTRLAWRDGEPWDGTYTWRPSSHIGGVGLMRTEAFLSRPALVPHGRHGFTNWQHEQEPVRGWIEPDLLAPQLDRIPTEPWASLSKRYVKKLWQRRWPPMDETWCRPYYDWVLDEVTV